MVNLEPGTQLMVEGESPVGLQAQLLALEELLVNTSQPLLRPVPLLLRPATSRTSSSGEL